MVGDDAKQCAEEHEPKGDGIVPWGGNGDQMVHDGVEEDALDEEYRALISRAQAAGGRLLSVDCRPSTIGMDEGTMDILDNVGFDQEYNEDGSITFCFEATDYTLEEGTVYQMEMFAQVDEWTAEGEVDEGKGAYQTWIVSFTPEFMDGRT